MFEGTSIESMTINSHDCAMFVFVTEFCIMGFICLFGIGGNTIASVVLWHEVNVTAPVFLLQAALIADIATLWILFLAEGIPSLEYINESLQNCLVICSYVVIITRPLLFLAQFTSVWFCLLALYGQYQMSCRQSPAESTSSISRARRQVLLVVVIGLILTVPLTFDTAFYTSAKQTLFQNYYYHTIYIYVVVFLFDTMVPLCFAIYLCLRLGLEVRSVYSLRRAIMPTHRLDCLSTTQVLLGLGITLIVCLLPQLSVTASHWANNSPQHTDPGNCGSLLFYLRVFRNLFTALNASCKLVIFLVLEPKFNKKLQHHFCPTSKGSMYQCSDRSEMTLISNIESSNIESPMHGADDTPVSRLLPSGSATCKDYKFDEC